MNQAVPAIELIAQDADAVRAAIEIGAARVELCSALALGGLTPSYGTIRDAVETAGGEVEVHVLIRPRAGGFVYDADEVRMMAYDVEQAFAAGAHGVVVGALSADGRFDTRAMRELGAAAGDGSVAAHRAIDVAVNRGDALEQLVDLGIRRVLTSGGAPTAIAGVEGLRALVEQSAGRIDIMAGSGVNSQSVATLMSTGVHSIHFSAKRSVADTSGVSMGSASAEGLGPYDKVDRDEARRIASIIRGGAV